jgi:hypothetical protein
MLKKATACLLAVSLMLLSVPAAFAASPARSSAEKADALFELGLFRGTGTDSAGLPVYSLDKPVTRSQALILLIRLLGKEPEALQGTYSIPFTDVSDTMKPYVGYAFSNGLSKGTSASVFGGAELAGAKTYTTFVLRALGYQDGRDFQYSTSLTFAASLGLADSSAESSVFTRGDAVNLSYAALSQKTADGAQTLAEGLISQGAVSAQAADAVGIVPLSDGVAVPTSYSSSGQAQMKIADILSAFPDAVYLTAVSSFSPDRTQPLAEMLYDNYVFSCADRLRNPLDCFTIQKLADWSSSASQAGQAVSVYLFNADQRLIACAYLPLTGSRTQQITFTRNLPFSENLDLLARLPGLATDAFAAKSGCDVTLTAVGKNRDGTTRFSIACPGKDLSTLRFFYCSSTDSTYATSDQEVERLLPAILCCAAQNAYRPTRAAGGYQLDGYPGDARCNRMVFFDTAGNYLGNLVLS